MYISRFLIFPFVAVLLLSASFAMAADEDCDLCPGEGICIPNPLQACTFNELVDAIITFIYNIALAVAPILIVISGFIFITSGGDPAGVQKAKDILLYTVIGFFVILLSKGLITILQDFFTNGNGS